jgi:N-acetylmuramoyl-L-alanine amidase
MGALLKQAVKGALEHMGIIGKCAVFVGMVLFVAGVFFPVHAEDQGGRGKPDSLKIVIDAGHGGKDSGALGPAGVMEKTITLSIAQGLARSLRDKGFDVIMTRDSDVFIPLRERTRIANKARADLFVSIHVNANDDKGDEGLETYILSLDADASSTRVARRENEAGPNVSGDLQFIIQDIAVNGKINESSLFASLVQKAVVSSLRDADLRCRDSGVHQAYFHVLVGALMPSILIETGFITNPGEVRLLQDREYQARMVEGIVQGIEAYRSDRKSALGLPLPRQTRQGGRSSG